MIGSWTFWSLIVSPLYLFALAAFSRMTIWHDSLGYEQLASLLANGQVWQYLATGPNREPLYPGLIATAMLLAKILGINYTSVIMVMQSILLLLTQMLMVFLMRRLKIRDGWQAAVICYSTFSPSLVNFTLILWSDLSPAPLILGGILAYARCWEHLVNENKGSVKLIGHAAWLGLFLITLTMLKAAFAWAGALVTVSYLFALPSLWQQKRRLTKLLLLVLTVGLIHQGAVHTYKWLNWKHNGHYALTDRGSWALYGNTMRRMEPMTPTKWLAAVAVMPHPDLCRAFMDTALCDYWGSDAISNNYGFGKKAELNAQVPRAQHDGVLTRLSLEAMSKNPLQAAALGFLEGNKLFFWEYYTPAAYIVYPRWAQAFYDFRPVMLCLRAVLGIMTVLGVLWAIVQLSRRYRHQDFLAQMRDERFLITFSILVWIAAYIIPYSFFFLFGRYALALAPMYLVLIAAMLNDCSARKYSSSSI